VVGLKVVSTKLSDDEYKVLMERVRKEGVSVADFVRKAILTTLNLPIPTQPEINDRLFALEKRVGDLERVVNEIKEVISKTTGAQTTTPNTTTARQRSKKTSWDILEEQKIICISTMVKARDPHKIIDILKDNGAIVLNSENDRCAIHPDEWMSFVESLTKISSPDEREVLSKLKGRAKQLFKMLRAVGAVHFDSKTKIWIIDTSVIEKMEGAPGLEEVREGGEKAESEYVVRVSKEDVGDVESYIADTEREGWICNEKSGSIICVWRELLEQVVVDLNNSKVGINDLEKALAGDEDKLEVGKAAYEAGILWYDGKQGRWRITS
jgi:hypothetical protein